MAAVFGIGIILVIIIDSLLYAKPDTKQTYNPVKSDNSNQQALAVYTMQPQQNFPMLNEPFYCRAKELKELEILPESSILTVRQHLVNLC